MAFSMAMKIITSICLKFNFFEFWPSPDPTVPPHSSLHVTGELSLFTNRIKLFCLWQRAPRVCKRARLCLGAETQEEEAHWCFRYSTCNYSCAVNVTSFLSRPGQNSDPGWNCSDWLWLEAHVVCRRPGKPIFQSVELGIWHGFGAKNYTLPISRYCVWQDGWCSYW